MISNFKILHVFYRYKLWCEIVIEFRNGNPFIFLPVRFLFFVKFLYWFIWDLVLTLNVPSLARQRCLPSWGPLRTPFFFNFSNVWCGGLLKLCSLGFWKYNSVIQALLASNILCLFISTEVTGSTELLHIHSSLIQHLNNVIFWALSEGHFSNLQRSEPKNNKNNNIPHL